MGNFLLLVGILLVAFIGYKFIKNGLLRFLGAILLLILGIAFKDYNIKSPVVGPTAMTANSNYPANSSSNASANSEINSSNENNTIADASLNKKNTLKSFHDVYAALERQYESEIKNQLGNPDVGGILDCVAYQCCSYYVYFDKVNSEGEIKHLVIMTFKGDIVNIVAVHEGEKVYTIFGRNTDAWDEYIKVSRSGVSSNSNQFTKTHG